MRIIQGILKGVSHLIGKMTKVHTKAELKASEGIFVSFTINDVNDKVNVMNW